MKFVDEFRDPAAARALVAAITDLAAEDEFKFMEVCGGHTHTIYRHGIEHLLPPSVELVHGPGCPVCVIPMGRIDDAMWLAEQDGVVFTTFGDMMRVPGSRGNLLEAKARRPPEPDALHTIVQHRAQGPGERRGVARRHVEPGFAMPVDPGHARAGKLRRDHRRAGG